MAGAPPNDCLRPHITHGNVRYNVECTHRKDADGLATVHVLLRFWNCGLDTDEVEEDPEEFGIEMKNGPNQQGTQWKMQNFRSDDEDDFLVISNVSETWGVPHIDCEYDGTPIPIRYYASFDEGHSLSIFYQNDRQVVFFTTVCHNRAGRDRTGRMIPEGLVWTRECDVWVMPNRCTRVSWQE
jgi:hypothetical protein